MTDKKKSFKDLILWQKADLLYHNIADDVSKFPKSKVADTLGYQLLDAVGSISANISEGYGRGGSKEFRQFLRIA